MKKILFYTDSLIKEMGGGITYSKAFMDYFSQHAYSIKTICSSEYNFSGWYPKVWRNYKIFNLPISLFRIFKDWWQYDIIIYKSNYIPSVSLNKKVCLIVDFPLQKHLGFFDRIRLRSVQKIICNSHFTAGWIKTYWGREATVIYPPAMESHKSDRNKVPNILSVGRFVEGGRSKNQEILIDAFKILYDKGWAYSLQLAGYVQDESYLNRLRTMAKGYPVEFIVNVSDTALITLYEKATFYWHACGFGIDASVEPSRTEHFGIAVADALSFGCIPLVYANGGPSEIVGGGNYGFVWKTQQELAEKTAACIASPDLIQVWQQKSLERSLLFSKKAFADSVNTLLQRSR